MDQAPPALPIARRGHAPGSERSGLGSIVFFAGIIVVVALAGGIGVLLWGPERTPSARPQLATNPPAPVELPSLSASAALASAPSATPEPAPTESAPAAATSVPKPKRGPRAPKKP